jgi:hypothetical protein
MDGDSVEVALAVTAVVRRDRKFDSLAVRLVVRVDVSRVWQVIYGIDFGLA